MKASVGSDQQEAKGTWKGEEKEQQEGICTLQAKGLPGSLISTGLYGNYGKKWLEKGSEDEQRHKSTLRGQSAPAS